MTDKIQELRARVAAAAIHSGRTPEDIAIVAVTKTQSPGRVDAALAAGLHIIGENKVQEASVKLPQLTQRFEQFHFIGHLQTNKVRALLKLNPALIHSVDSLQLAEKLEQVCSETGRVQNILLQVNTTQEDSKGGFEPAELLAQAQVIRDMQHLRVCGLMTIGWFSDNPEVNIPCFEQIKRLAEEMQDYFPAGQIRWLSMGMSDDFEVAIRHGANLIRVGTAIFGARA